MLTEKTRIIARLDLKGTNLIKGICFEGLRIIGDPKQYSLEYYTHGVDEILIIDTVASLYNRNNLVSLVNKISENIFIPVTVGGGVRSVEDALSLLQNGADKIAINSAAIKDINLLEELSSRFGAQCVVLSVEAKKLGEGRWEVYYDNGREKTGWPVDEWISKAQRYGVGEVLLTSVDKDGTKKGFDYELYERVAASTNVPIIISGGFGSTEHLKVLHESKLNIDAIAIASCFHDKKYKSQDIKRYIEELNNLDVVI